MVGYLWRFGCVGECDMVVDMVVQGIMVVGIVVMMVVTVTCHRGGIQGRRFEM